MTTEKTTTDALIELAKNIKEGKANAINPNVEINNYFSSHKPTEINHVAERIKSYLSGLRIFLVEKGYLKTESAQEEFLKQFNEIHAYSEQFFNTTEVNITIDEDPSITKDDRRVKKYVLQKLLGEVIAVGCKYTHLPATEVLKNIQEGEQFYVWQQERKPLLTLSEKDDKLYIQIEEPVTTITKVVEDEFNNRHTKKWYTILPEWQRQYIDKLSLEEFCKARPALLRYFPGISNHSKHTFVILKKKEDGLYYEQMRSTNIRAASLFPDGVKDFDEAQRITQLNLQQLLDSHGEQIQQQYRNKWNYAGAAAIENIGNPIFLNQSYLSPGIYDSDKSVLKKIRGKDNNARMVKHKNRAVDALANTHSDFIMMTTNHPINFLRKGFGATFYDKAYDHDAAEIAKIFIDTVHNINSIFWFNFLQKRMPELKVKANSYQDLVGKATNHQYSLNNPSIHGAITLDCFNLANFFVEIPFHNIFNASYADPFKNLKNYIEEHIIEIEKKLAGVSKKLALLDKDQNKINGQERLEYTINNHEKQAIADLKLINLVLSDYLDLTLNPKQKPQGHYRQLFLTSLELIITEKTSSLAEGSCQHGKDRTSMVNLHRDAMLAYYEKYGFLPCYGDEPEKRANFNEIFADLFFTKHHPKNASQNAPGSEGLMHLKQIVAEDTYLVLKDRDKKMVFELNTFATFNAPRMPDSAQIKLPPDEMILKKQITHFISGLNTHIESFKTMINKLSPQSNGRDINANLQNESGAMQSINGNTNVVQLLENANNELLKLKEDAELLNGNNDTKQLPNEEKENSLPLNNNLSEDKSQKILTRADLLSLEKKYFDFIKKHIEKPLAGFAPTKVLANNMKTFFATLFTEGFSNAIAKAIKMHKEFLAKNTLKKALNAKVFEHKFQTNRSKVNDTSLKTIKTNSGPKMG